jgi:hypothetical protein
MIGGVISLFAILFSLQMFTFSIQYNKISETVKSIPTSLIKSCVVYDEMDDFYFLKKEDLKNKSIEYISENLKSIINKCKVYFTYYDNNENEILSNKPIEVQIRLEAFLLFDYSYIDSINFKVREVFERE